MTYYADQIRDYASSAKIFAGNAWQEMRKGDDPSTTARAAALSAQAGAYANAALALAILAQVEATE